MTLVITAFAGAIGAMCRYLLTGFVQDRSRSALPLGTFAVNLVGAFSLGLIAGNGQPYSSGVLALVGFLGGFTTFSTWMVETLRLGAVPRPRLRAVANMTVTLFVGVALAATGFMLTN